MRSSDKLIIDTPEQVHLEFTLAGIGSRFMALLIDTILQSLVYFAVFLLAVFIIGVAPAVTIGRLGTWAAAVVVLFLFCLYWGYFATFETLWKGQTPGKRYAGIRVIKDSGRPITAFEAIARNLLRVIDQIPGIYVVGMTCMFLNKRNRRLGDFVAGSPTDFLSRSTLGRGLGGAARRGARAERCPARCRAATARLQHKREGRPCSLPGRATHHPGN